MKFNLYRNSLYFHLCGIFPHKWNSIYIGIPFIFICAEFFRTNVWADPGLNSRQKYISPHALATRPLHPVFETNLVFIKLISLPTFPPPHFFLPQLSFLPPLFFYDFFSTPTLFELLFFFCLKVGGGGERRAERHYFATRSRSDLVTPVIVRNWFPIQYFDEAFGNPKNIVLTEPYRNASNNHITIPNEIQSS